jgi:hypothetical protein
MKPTKISVIVELEVSLNSDTDTSGLVFTKDDVTTEAVVTIKEKLGRVFCDPDDFLNFEVKRVKGLK